VCDPVCGCGCVAVWVWVWVWVWFFLCISLGGQVEQNIMSLQKSPTQLIASGKTALEICEALSAGLREKELVPTYTVKPRFTCKSGPAARPPRASPRATCDTPRSTTRCTPRPPRGEPTLPALL
jgi:hypothetical protein